ncbi:MAG TPA: filamentous hemagglutinin N-terminal domain-containing protein [Leptolyngbyaceae cyanobacterium]
MQLRLYTCWFAVGIVSCCLLTANPVRAQQVSADGTTSTSVTSPDGSNFTIKDGDRSGDNLFHSFSEFSVPTEGSALFDNDLDVKNIISRVTGGKISNIDGLLGAKGSANLFLLNPSGIIFGANASLNIGGSFISSTANSLKFADGTEFSALAASSPPLLTVSVPVGLQYGANAAGINVQNSNLAVQPEQTLALVGGNITLAGGNLTAPSGRIDLGAVAGAGNVQIANVNNQLQLSFPDDIQKADVAIIDAANVSASGNGGGDLQLTGRQIKVERSRLEANTFGSEPGGNFNVNASESVELIGNEPGELFDNGLFAETIALINWVRTLL